MQPLPPAVAALAGSRRTAVVLTVAAALIGAGVTAAPASGPRHEDPMKKVARQVLSVGVPGYVARIDDGRRVRITAAGVADPRIPICR